MPINALGNAQRWQPTRPVRLNRAHPLATGLIFSAYNSAVDALLPPFDYVAVRIGTSAGIASASDALAVSSKFDGSTSKAQFTTLKLDTLAPRIFTVTLSLWWDAYANDNDLALEYGAAAFNNGANGWQINPNLAAGNWCASIGMSAGGVAQTLLNRSALPVGQWNNVAVLFNRNDTGKGTDGVYVNGAVVSYTTNAVSATAVDNSNTNLNFMCRNNGASQFGAGRLRNVNIYNRALSADEIYALHSNPYQLVEPVRRVVYGIDGFSDPGAPPPSTGSKTRFFLAA